MQSAKPQLFPQPPPSQVSIFFKTHQLSYSPSTPNPNIQILISTPSQHHSPLFSSIQSQTKFQTLKNPSKYPSKQLSHLHIHLSNYLSQQMLIAQHFSSLDLDDQQESKQILFYLHPFHYQLMGLCDDFVEYFLESWRGKLKVGLKDPNILLLTGDFKLETISRVRKEIEGYFRKTFVVRWEKAKVHVEHLGLLEKMGEFDNVEYFYDEGRTEYIYFYTKGEKEANAVLKLVTNLETREIDLRAIFVHEMKYQMFARSYLEELDGESFNVVTRVDKDRVTVFGLIPDVLEYEKLLHIRFASVIIKDLEFEFSLPNCALVNKYIKMLKEWKEYKEVKGESKNTTNKNIQVKQAKQKTNKSKQKKLSKLQQVHLLYKHKKNPEGIDLVHIFVYSYSVEKLNKVFYEFINELKSVRIKVISVPGELRNRHVREIKGVYKLNVVQQPGVVLVEGLPENIALFEKNFKFAQLVRKEQPKPIEKKKRALRGQLQKEPPNHLEYSFYMKKQTSSLFETLFGNDLEIRVKYIEDLAVVSCRVPSTCSNLADLQERIYDFSVKHCTLSSKQDLHSTEHKFIEPLQIDKETVSLLKRWGWDYKLVLELKKVHNKPYEILYRSCKDVMEENYIWMEVALPIEVVETLIQEDIRELSKFQKSGLVYKFNTRESSISLRTYNCILLATTFKPTPSATISLCNYQFLPLYFIKINNISIKTMKSKQSF